MFGDILVFQHVLVMHFTSDAYDAKCITIHAEILKYLKTQIEHKEITFCVDRVPNNNKIRSGCPRGEVVL